MSATTRWRDTITKAGIGEIVDQMTSPVQDDERSGSYFWKKIRCRRVFEDPVLQKMMLNGEEISYSAVHYSYDAVTAGDVPDEDRILAKNGLIVIYRSKGKTYYIVDQNSTAQKLLRKILGYTGKSEIQKSNFDFPGDFFVWLVSRVYNSDCEIANTATDEEKVLELEEIKGIRGNTEDLQTIISASGESVMNVISTLSFLLESRKLNQVILNLRYSEHENICVKIQNATVEYQRPYKGVFEEDPQNDPDQFSAKLYLLLYLEILPLLEQEYRSNLDTEAWGPSAYRTFLQELKDNIIQKIEEKINSVKQ